MTTEGKVSPLPVLALMPLPVRCIDYNDNRYIVGADGRWLAQVNRQVIEEFALRINAHDRLVAAIERFIAAADDSCDASHGHNDVAAILEYNTAFTELSAALAAAKGGK